MCPFGKSLVFVDSVFSIKKKKKVIIAISSVVLRIGDNVAKMPNIHVMLTNIVRHLGTAASTQVLTVGRSRFEFHCL